MMKKTVVLTILALVGLVGCSRYDKNPLVEVKGFYETPHQLRKMFVEEKEVIVRKPSRDNLSGGFFLFIGGVSGEYKEGTTTKYQVTHVRFAWEIKDNTYVITTLPLEKIRIKLVEKDLGRILRNYYNPHEALTEYLDYAVFTVGDGDWPKNINLPTGGFSQ